MGQTKHIKQYLKQHLSPSRYRHTLGVRKAARRLARRHLCFGCAKAKKRYLKLVGLAALLHDADKGRATDELKEQLLQAEPALFRAIEPFPEIWHAFTAAHTARDRFGVTDADLLNALRFHTTGRAGMSPLEKILYLADAIEAGRDFPGIRAIRRAARRSLDLGCLLALGHSTTYLMSQGQKISPLTLEARKELLEHGIF